MTAAEHVFGQKYAVMCGRIANPSLILFLFLEGKNTTTPSCLPSSPRHPPTTASPPTTLSQSTILAKFLNTRTMDRPLAPIAASRLRSISCTVSLTRI
mmetsp:Transcript_10384/g.38532  ORF Transcript_10384/g.38532 Transcript_10384/m.38532 type:complete len:98 (+) Transcript_10384:96-389(+)